MNLTETKTNITGSHFFGQSLVDQGLITTCQLEATLVDQEKIGGRVGELLVKKGVLSDNQITEALAKYLSVDYVRMDDIEKVDLSIARLLPEQISKRFCLVAYGQEDEMITVAMADPLNVVAIDTVELTIKQKIKPVISSKAEILNTIEMVYHGLDIEEQQLRDLVELEVDEGADGLSDEFDDSNEAEATKAPVIRFVDLLLHQAAKAKASDIHVEPQERSMSVRMRIDGVLTEMVPPAKSMQAAVITRIKILSGLDIAERRHPQDGRLKIRVEAKNIDVRVSVIPTIYGEKIVMRILDSSAASHDVNKIGFSPKNLEIFKNALNQPHGIVVVTGPTGSGKSTTLYSALNYLKDPTKNITTVEDPVEYRMHGINQVQVKSEIDLTFASCLRSILRQDPDIILIGEIRDKETVDIAIKAALTGHLVLSTFHTNDAPSTISRMVYMGIEPYLLASTLNLVIAQRLVRRICEHCKEPVQLDELMLKKLQITPEQAAENVFYHGAGCKKCNGTGYSGRLAVFEFLAINSDLRELIVRGATEKELRQAARDAGCGGLMDSGVRNMIAGNTTAEEVMRVSYMEDISA